jgi:hypothetical protein
MFNNVFSTNPIIGTITINHAKYSAVKACPTPTNGDSTCWLPIYINTPNVPTNNQKAALIKGLNSLPLILLVSTIGITNKINKLENIAITPNNLLGMLLKIA